MQAILYTSPCADDPQERQLDRLRMFCAAMEYRVAGKFLEQSPDNGRPVLTSAIEECRREKKLVLVVTDLERLGPTSAAVTVLETLHQAKCDFIALRSRINTTTPEGKTFWATLAMMRQLLSEPPKRPKNKKKPPGKTTFGFRRGPDGLEPHPKEQAALDMLRRFASGGRSPGEICKAMDEAGIMHRGRKWHGCNTWVRQLLARKE